MDNSTFPYKAIVHGGIDPGELEILGLSPDDVVDFSVNVNPYGPSPNVLEAVTGVTIARYPDRECLQLRRTLLEQEIGTQDISLESIVCGNGAAELIWAVARAYLAPGEKAALIHPTFGEYYAASHAIGASVVAFQTHVSEEFQIDVEAVTAWLDSERASLLWLCNPNNPTGVFIGHEHMIQIAEACKRNGTILVVDEAYWRFVTPLAEPSALELLTTAGHDTIIVLRSLTKDFALAGLRLGFAVASPRVAERLRAQLPPWNVSTIAQAAGIAALGDRVHLQTTLTQLRYDRDRFYSGLRSIGVKVMPSRTHFYLLEVGNARQVRNALLHKQILVRDCTSFGLPGMIRVATRPIADWQQLWTALKEVT